MKQNFIKVLMIIGFSTISYAGCVAGWCSNVTVDRILATNDGTILVKTNGNQNLLNCTQLGTIYLTLQNSDLGQKNVYSLLLTAKTTKEKVFIRIVEGSTNCRVAYAY